MAKRTDTVSQLVRSATMRAVKSRNVKSTERKLRAAMVSKGLKGWRMYADELPGKPDFVFLKEQLAIFVDGCFWHGCPQCYRRPHSNQKYWDAKVIYNVVRDRRNRNRLKRSGWRVVRVWEHELRQNTGTACAKIGDALVATKREVSTQQLVRGVQHGNRQKP